MKDLYNESMKKDKDVFVEENQELKDIDKIEDPKLLDEIEKKLEIDIDNSAAEEKITEKPEEKKDNSLITDEFIEAQPEEKREALALFKGKGKDELLDIAAKSIVDKTPIFKDDEAALKLVKEKLTSKTDEEILTLISGSEISSQAKKEEIQKSAPLKIELPEIPKDDPDIQKEVERETLKRLKAIYPNMPEVNNKESEAYKEWRRDLDLDNPDNNFKEDLSKTQTSIESEVAKLVYIKKEFPNLYDESPEEVLPLLTNQNLPRLKALNDNPTELLVQDLQTEIELIRAKLAKYGLTEKDLDQDFTITKDDKGMPYNKLFNDLITVGKSEEGALIPSEEIVGSRGKTFWLRKGKLFNKYKEEFDDKILTAYVAKKTQTDKIRKEKLKDETIIEGKGSSHGSGKKIVTLSEIEKAENPEYLDKVIADMEKE